MLNVAIFRSLHARVVLFAVAVVYLTFSIGVIKATHFCMGRAASITYFSAEAKKCLCSSYSSSESSCCDDSNELVKIDDDHSGLTAYHLSIPHLFVLEDLYTERYIAAQGNELVTPAIVSDTGPPDVPLFKLHCTYLLYDAPVA